MLTVVLPAVVNIKGAQIDATRVIVRNKGRIIGNGHLMFVYCACRTPASAIPRYRNCIKALPAVINIPEFFLTRGCWNNT